MIDQFRLTDLKAVLTLEKRCFAEDAYSAPMFIQCYLQARDKFIVARLDGKIAGYMITVLDRDTGYIVSIAIDPAFQRMSVGTQLLQTGIGQLALAGAQRVALHVRISNTQAIQFYRKFGFEVVGTEPDYYADGEDAFVMEKAIKSNKKDQSNPD